MGWETRFDMSQKDRGPSWSSSLPNSNSVSLSITDDCGSSFPSLQIVGFMGRSSISLTKTYKRVRVIFVLLYIRSLYCFIKWKILLNGVLVLNGLWQFYDTEFPVKSFVSLSWCRTLCCLVCPILKSYV